MGARWWIGQVSEAQRRSDGGEARRLHTIWHHAEGEASGCRALCEQMKRSMRPVRRAEGVTSVTG